MGSRKLAAAVLLAAASAAGLVACGSDEARLDPVETAPPVSAAPPDAPDAAPPEPREPLIVAARDATPEERRRFEAELAEQVRRLQKQVDSVRELAEHEAGDLGDELERRTRRLEDKSEELERKVASMKHASEQEWRTLHGEVQRLVSDIQEESGRMIEALH